MNPPTHDELFKLEHDLAMNRPVDMTRLREIVWLYGELRKNFSDLAECQLATEEGLLSRKSSSKSEIRRMQSIKDKYITLAVRIHGIEAGDRGQCYNLRVQELSSKTAQKSQPV